MRNGKGFRNDVQKVRKGTRGKVEVMRSWLGEFRGLSKAPGCAMIYRDSYDFTYR